MKRRSFLATLFAPFAAYLRADQRPANLVAPQTLEFMNAFNTFSAGPTVTEINAMYTMAWFGGRPPDLILTTGEELEVISRRINDKA